MANGKGWYELDAKFPREHLNDILAGVDFLAEQEPAAKNRLPLFGSKIERTVLVKGKWPDVTYHVEDKIVVEDRVIPAGFEVFSYRDVQRMRAYKRKK